MDWKCLDEVDLEKNIALFKANVTSEKLYVEKRILKAQT